jgi:hypothetical protein
MIEKAQAQPTENAGEDFWQGVVRFRETIEKSSSSSLMKISLT